MQCVRAGCCALLHPAHADPKACVCGVLQESSIYTPAAGVLAAAGAVPLQHYTSPAKQGQPIYELRQYQVGGQQL